MGVSGQRHAPGKGPPVPIGQEAGWAPEPVWTQRTKEKSFAPAGDRTPIARSSRGLSSSELTTDQSATEEFACTLLIVGKGTVKHHPMSAGTNPSFRLRGNTREREKQSLLLASQ
jgi:hypothetical protein